MEIGISHYLTVSAILFTLGVFGIFLNRKNVIVILMSVELILLSVNLNFVAFSSVLGDMVGQVFALFVLTVAAAEAAIGLAILVVFFRNRGSIAVEDVNVMKVDGQMLYYAIVFLPLIGFLVAGLFGNKIGAKASEYITSGLMVIVAILSWVVFFKIPLGHDAETIRIPVLHWVTSGSLSFDWALRVDTLTGVMLVVINSVSALVHIYSIGYMHHDPHRPRFFAYLSLFTFAMLMLVTSDNLIQMFFGWEGVGLASYLLIGFWFQKPSANAAAMKAFVVNRVGDFGFLLGIFGLFALFQSVDYNTIFSAAATYLPAEGASDAGSVVLNFLGYELHKETALTVVCLLLFMGAMGKSAQFLLHTGFLTRWKARHLFPRLFTRQRW